MSVPVPLIDTTQDVAIECEGRKVEWWKVHEEGLPNWSTAVKKVLLGQPSSAAEEKEFLARSQRLLVSSKIMPSRTTCKQA